MNGLYGWTNLNLLARDLWDTPNSNILLGDFVFAVRSKDIEHLVITWRNDLGLFSLAYSCQGYTMLLPRVEKSRLQVGGDLFDFLVEKKIKKDILENLQLILN